MWRFPALVVLLVGLAAAPAVGSGPREGSAVVPEPDRLGAIEEIRQLKARYFRFLDTKDWARFATVFAPDAVMDPTGDRDAARVLHGRAAIVEFVKKSVDGVTTVHHGHMPEIDITGPDSATGIWAMEDILRYPAGGPRKWLHGYGHYHETYRRLDGEWRIESIRLTRLRMDME